MAGDKFFIVLDPTLIEGSYDHLWQDYPTDEERLQAVCYGLRDGGMDSDTLVRIIYGSGNYADWKRENAVVYSDKATAVADAKKRLAAITKKGKPKQPKKASVSERIVERFKSAKG